VVERDQLAYWQINKEVLKLELSTRVSLDRISEPRSAFPKFESYQAALSIL